MPQFLSIAAATKTQAASSALTLVEGGRYRLQALAQPPVSGIGRVSRMPVHPLVDVGQLERRFERPDMRRMGKALRSSFKDEADEVRSLNQEWDE
jgi:hypothetical protein